MSLPRKVIGACILEFKYLPPWGVEFNEEQLVLGHFLIEVLVSEDHDTILHLGSGGSPQGED